MSRIFLIEDGNYSKRLRDALSEHQIFSFSALKDLTGEIVIKKPQLIFIPSGLANRRSAKYILKKFPFIPVIAYGEFGKTQKKSERRIKEFISAGYAACITVQSIVEKDVLIKEVENVLWKGLADETLWDKERSITVEDNRNSLKQNIAGGVITAVVVLLFGFIFIERILPEKKLIPKSYSITGGGVSGMAIMGDTLWSVEWKSQSIYQYKIGQKISLKKVFSFPERRFAGISIGDGKLWALDSWNKTITTHNFDAQLSLTGEFDCPGDAPSSITYDGNYLLVSDAATNRVFVIKPEEGYKTIKEFQLPGMSAADMYSDGKYLWVMDSSDNKLYKCRFTDFELVVEGIFLQPGFEDFKAMVVSGDKDYLWLASEQDNKLYRYPKKFLESL
ncbi:MAG: hypothetical protein AB1633_04815 [Elusimicrobiota bacterium]